MQSWIYSYWILLDHAVDWFYLIIVMCMLIIFVVEMSISKPWRIFVKSLERRCNESPHCSHMSYHSLTWGMHRFAKCQAPPNAVDFLWFCEEWRLVKGSFFCVLHVSFSPDNITLYLFGLKLTMYCYKWSWLTVANLSIAIYFKGYKYVFVT